MGKTGKRAVLIGAAPESDWSFLDLYLHPDDQIICIDGGLNTAKSLGLKPDWYVGDSDSGGSPCIPTSEVLPSEKDLSDLEMALSLARRLDLETVVLCGCLGGRQDHHFANLMLLSRAYRYGLSALIADSQNEIHWLSPGRTVVPTWPSFRYFGIVPVDAALVDVTIRNAKYTVVDISFHRSRSLGISNEFLPGQSPEITYTAGEGLLILSQRL